MGLRDRNFSRSLARIILRASLALAVVGLVLVGTTGLGTPTALATAGINPTINFQGRLLTAAGAVVADGNYNVEFRIYQDGTGTAAYNGGSYASPTGLDWAEDYLVSNGKGVVVKNGYFSVNLGSICLLSGGSCLGNTNSAVNFNDTALWLSMNIAGGSNATASCATTATTFWSTCTPDGEMLPMNQMASAVYANNSAELGGLTSSAFLLQGPTAATPDTITPTGSTTGLTVNGSSTATLAVNVLQGQAADGVDVALSAAGTNVNGLLVSRAVAGTTTNGLDVTNATGTTTNGLAITNTSGTMTNGILFGGTIGTDINTTTGATSPSLVISTGAATGTTAGNITIDNGTSTSGVPTINIGTGNYAHTIQIGNTGATGVQAITVGSTGNTGNTVSIQGGTTVNTAIQLSTSGAGGITIDSGGAGAVKLGSANATAVTVGNSGAVTTIAGSSTSTRTWTSGSDIIAFGSQTPTTSGTVTYQLPAGGTAGNNYAICTAVAICAAPAGSGNYLVQTPSGTGTDTITPTGSTTGLTVNGSSTATLAVNVLQGQAADGVDVALSAAGTNVNGLLVSRAVAGTTTNGLDVTNATGTTTNGLAITNTSGTMTNGILFGGTIGTDINTTTGATSPSLVISTGAATGTTAGNITIDNGTSTSGVPTINIGTGNYAHTIQIGNTGATGVQAITVGSTGNTGNTVSIQGGTTVNTAIQLSTSGAGGITIDSGGAGAVKLGSANATAVNIGGASTAATTIAGGNNAHTVAIGAGGTTTVQGVTVGSTGSTSTTTIQGGTSTSAIGLTTGNNASGAGGNINLTTGTSSSGNASIVAKSGTNSTAAFQIQNSASTGFFTADSTKDIINTNDISDGAAANASGGRLFSDGFETGNASAWLGGSSGTATTNETTTVRSGKYSSKIATAANNGYVQTSILSNSTVYARTYFDVTSLGNPTNLMDVGPNAVGGLYHVVITVGAGGDLCYAYNGGAAVCSATAPSTSAWHKLEIEYVQGTGANGVLQVYLDNVLTSINVSTGTWTTDINNFAIGSNANTTATAYFDDASVDTVATGDSSSLTVNDTLRVSGTTSIGDSLLVGTGTSGSGGGGTPTFDNGTYFGTTSATKVTTLSGSFTINSGHSNYYLVVGVFDDQGNSAPTVTYNGVTMGSPLITGGIGNIGGNGVFLYGLVAPSTGTNTLLISGGSGDWMVSAEDFYNVNQSTPTAGTAHCQDGSASGSGTTGCPTTGNNYPTLPITTTAGDVVTDFLTSTAGLPASAGSGQTQADYGTDSFIQYGPGAQGQSYKTAAGSSTTMSWTLNTASYWWGTMGVDLKGAQFIDTSQGTLTVKSEASTTGSSSYTTAGSGQTFVVPQGVTSITTTTWGAGGGGGAGDTASEGFGGDGGGGGFVRTTLAVSPGETLTVDVGSGGAKFSVAGAGGGGGGFSDIKRGATELAQAGGGGGGGGTSGFNDGTWGGEGGGGNGYHGGSSNAYYGAAGLTGSAGAGGAGTTGGVAGHAGGANFGGDAGGSAGACATAPGTTGNGGTGGGGKGGNSGSCSDAGGGGGGAYGGGGGGSNDNGLSAGAGGGGSGTCTGTCVTQSVGTATGINPSGGTTDGTYSSCASNAAYGGTGSILYGGTTAGYPGCVVISYTSSTAHANALDVQTSAGTDMFKITAAGAAAFQTSLDTTQAYQFLNSTGGSVLTIDTADGDVIIGAGSTGEATGKLLVQDSASASPTEQDGGIYYNDVYDAYMCGVNGAWSLCGDRSWSVNGASASGSTTSTTYANWPGTNNSITFTKAATSSNLVVYIDVNPWDTVAAATVVGIDVKIGSTDYPCGQFWYNATGIHEDVSCRTIVTGVAAGSQTATIQWAVVGGGTGTINADGNTWGDMTIEETN